MPIVRNVGMRSQNISALAVECEPAACLAQKHIGSRQAGFNLAWNFLVTEQPMSRTLGLISQYTCFVCKTIPTYCHAENVVGLSWADWTKRAFGGFSRAFYAAGCTGKRSRTGLVKVADFTEKQLLADIRLMEEIERECGAAKRREPQRLPAKMPPFLQELQREVSSSFGECAHTVQSIEQEVTPQTFQIQSRSLNR